VRIINYEIEKSKSAGLQYSWSRKFVPQIPQWYNLHMTRFNWDPEGKSERNLLKEYEHWILTVSSHQHTLGCFIIISKSDIERISEAKPEGLAELALAMREIENALSKSKDFNPDRFNYLQLGNGWHHLHFHGIPRYKNPRFFDGKEWVDKEWGKPPVWNLETSAEDLILKLKNAILEYLPK
jgi:diadenosine tetraphosphate (Ap4A) HIT family hydrolase